MQAFYKLEEIVRTQLVSGAAYQEFLRAPAMSCGVYTLAAGATDTQKPHAEDELYYVIDGAARMMVYNDKGAEQRAVGAGDIIFVKAGQEHRFHDITRDLVVLVIFAPAESMAKVQR